VGGLNFGITTEVLETAFMRFGLIVDCVAMLEKGFGSVSAAHRPPPPHRSTT
jgi:hypothetical protein